VPCKLRRFFYYVQTSFEVRKHCHDGFLRGITGTVRVGLPDATKLLQTSLTGASSFQWTWILLLNK
jgi:hypothetical protein